MISILICSVNDEFLNQVKKSIEETVGTDFEIIAFDNKKAGIGICEVYNILAKKAKYPYLCFVHEDVLFTTINWGKRIEEIFANQAEIGVVGIAGSKYKSAAYSGWFTGIKEFDCANYSHRYTYGDEKVYFNPGEDRLQEVVCLDGVFICCRSTIWQQVMFDEQHLKGFHFYDISFTLNAASICSVVVTYDIDLMHITKGGDFGNNWIEAAMLYHKLAKGKMPLTKLSSIPADANNKIIVTWLDQLKKYRISAANKLKWVGDQRLYRNPTFFYPILKFFIYTPLGLKHFHNLLRKNRI